MQEEKTTQKITQKTKVVNELLKNRSVNNFWAIRNYILRLGAIIHSLKIDGWEFSGNFGENEDRKNYSYSVIKQGCLVMKPSKKHEELKQPEQKVRNFFEGNNGQGKLL